LLTVHQAKRELHHHANVGLDERGFSADFLDSETKPCPYRRSARDNDARSFTRESQSRGSTMPVSAPVMKLRTVTYL